VHIKFVLSFVSGLTLYSTLCANSPLLHYSVNKMLKGKQCRGDAAGSAILSIIGQGRDCLVQVGGTTGKHIIEFAFATSTCVLV
jgi:hypothetical protein